MNYGDVMTAIGSLNTGNIPDNVDFLTKLICGKIARKRIPELVKLAEITTGGLKDFDLRILVPDFFDFKLDFSNKNNFIYSLDSSNEPSFFKLVSPALFAQNTWGGFAKKVGPTLSISTIPGDAIPTKIYFPYYSFYCWQDADTGVTRETPVNNDNICLLPSVFDDVIIDGLLLYISRREKESKEYQKNVIEWEKRLNDIIFLS